MSNLYRKAWSLAFKNECKWAIANKSNLAIKAIGIISYDREIKRGVPDTGMSYTEPTCEYPLYTAAQWNDMYICALNEYFEHCIEALYSGKSDLAVRAISILAFDRDVRAMLT